MEGVKGSLRLVGSRDVSGHWELYFRPPATYLQPATLLTILRRRLTPQAEVVV